MNRFKKAEEFGRLMGKIAANDQFIGPKGPVPTSPNPAPKPKQPYVSVLDRPENKPPVRTPTMADTARDVRGTIDNMNSKADFAHYRKGLKENIYEQKSFPRQGTLMGEIKNQEDEQNRKALNTVASTLGVNTAGHLAGHALHGPLAKGLGAVADRFPLAGYAAPIASYAAKPIANFAGHELAARAIHTLGGEPVHMSSAAKVGPAIDLAKGAYNLYSAAPAPGKPSSGEELASVPGFIGQPSRQSMINSRR